MNSGNFEDDSVKEKIYLCLRIFIDSPLMKAFFLGPTPPSVTQLWLVTEEGVVTALILYYIASQGSCIIIKIGRIQHTV